MSILCVGEMVADIVVRPVPADVQQRDSTIVEEISVVNGGDALNTAVGLGRLGHDVAFIGKAGKDDFGRMLVDIARNAGVDVSHVKVSQIYDNSKVVALISADGQRSFLHCPGSNQEFSADDIEEDVLWGKNVFHIGGMFHLPSFDGEKGAAGVLARAQALGAKTCMDVAFDHSGRWLETIGCCLPHLDFFMPSIGEVREMLNISDEVEAARRFKEMGVRNVVIKLGEAGVYCSPQEEKAFYCDCYHVQAVDTTGAGDGFVGGFIGALDSGKCLEDCVLEGTANAAFVVQKVGATAGVPSRAELEAFIRDKNRPKVRYV